MTVPVAKTPYPPVDARPSFPAIEERVLAYWKEHGIFQRTIDEREAGENGSNEFVFYDGPPFANGLPHYGHLLTGYAKDVVPRYQTMKGRRVERRFGWDCHGLPAEMKAEQELGVSGRRAITEYGIAEFNAHCRASVMKFSSEWEHYVTRQARWVDFANDYKTMDLSYMESVIWAFKQLHDKGLIYEAFRVMPYSWAAETPLSNFEIRLDDATRPRQDPAVTVSLDLEPQPGDTAPLRMLIWTTTPWTLPSNLAVAVGPEIDYVMVEREGVRFVIGAQAAGGYEKQLEGATVVGALKGRDLVGRRYQPLFPFFEGHPGAFRVLAADFVDTSEGTGIVHMAPGFGEDDQLVCEANGIELVVPVDDEGKFTDEVAAYAGLNVFEANKPIIRDLKERGVLIRHDTVEHNYPHCWRTDQPVIYKALSSWYVKVTDFRDRMVELNQGINWIPDHVKNGQFGKWLAGARDWSISRNRFWGTPIPVWRSDDPAFPRIDVYGSLDELERDFGVRLDDLHRPAVDALTRKNPDDPSGRSTMRRVPEVLDCWFESGSMPYAQIHYPFENRSWFESHFPADYIVEYVAQTRGWFYTLMVLSTALFDRPPFENCICHGVLVDQDGRKLSKRLDNYMDPELAFEQLGSDALRWRLMAAPVLRGLEMKVDKSGKDVAEVIRLVINPVWNAFSFFVRYANVDGHRARVRTDSTQLLDRYVLAKTRALVEQVGAAMDAYDLSGACARIDLFIDALNNWYIRRSRDRFWNTSGAGVDEDAYDTLYTVLTTLCRVAAPLLPMISEEIYRALTGEVSVHLARWPSADELPADPELVRDMDRVREVCSIAHSIREEHDLRTRLPLHRLTVAGEWGRTLDQEPLRALLRDEVNVKEVVIAPSYGLDARLELRPDGRALGPRLGRAMKDVQTAARSGSWERLEGGRIGIADQVLEPGEFELKLAGFASPSMRATPSQDTVLMLALEVTPELRAEGTARDFVRHVQSLRKDAALDLTDRIELFLTGPGAAVEAVRAHEGYVRDQVLATALAFDAPPVGAHAADVTLDGHAVRVGFVVANG